MSSFGVTGPPPKARYEAKEPSLAPIIPMSPVPTVDAATGEVRVRTNVTAAVTPTTDESRPTTSVAGSVRLRGIEVPLESELGRAFVVDCARNTEGILSDLEIKAKYELSDEDWKQLAINRPLLHSVREERERRIFSGEASREAAQRHFAKAPHVLNGILTDEQAPPRHRIEAARELRQAATGNGDALNTPREKFTIVIDLGSDMKIEKEFTAPLLQQPADDGEGR